MSGSPSLLTELRAGVLLLRLNRPERHNALGGTAMRDLAAAFERAATDDEVKVVVTSAVGADFCVGVDAADMTGDLPAARELLASPHIAGDKGLAPLTAGQLAVDDCGNTGRWTRRLWQLEKPTIAVVRGRTVGGGLALAMLHDIVLAADTTRISAGYSALGIPPEFGLSLLLPAVVGRQTAADLLLGGRVVDAEAAHRMQLVADVLPDDRVDEEAMCRARRMAQLPAAGLQWTKRLLRHASRHAMEDQLHAEYAAQLALFDNPNTRATITRVMGGLTGPPGTAPSS